MRRAFLEEPRGAAPVPGKEPSDRRGPPSGSYPVGLRSTRTPTAACYGETQPSWSQLVVAPTVPDISYPRAERKLVGHRGVVEGGKESDTRCGYMHMGPLCLVWFF